MMLWAQSADKAQGTFSIVWLLLIVTAFYLFAIRPNRRRLRAMQEAQAALVPGRAVITNAGLYATVVDVDAETATLEIAPGVNARFARGAIVKVIDDSPAIERIEETEPGES